MINRSAGRGGGSFFLGLGTNFFDPLSTSENSFGIVNFFFSSNLYIHISYKSGIVPSITQLIFRKIIGRVMRGDYSFTQAHGIAHG